MPRFIVHEKIARRPPANSGRTGSDGDVVLVPETHRGGDWPRNAFRFYAADLSGLGLELEIGKVYDISATEVTPAPAE